MRVCLVAGLILAILVGAAAGQRPRGRNQPPRRDRPSRQQTLKQDAAALLKQFDTNKDGTLAASELPEALRRRFARLDANRDAKLSLAELLAARTRGRLGEIDTGPARDGRRTDTLRVGEPAPDFTLQDPSGKRRVRLSQFRGKKPVVLIFGSYT